MTTKRKEENWISGEENLLEKRIDSPETIPRLTEKNHLDSILEIFDNSEKVLCRMDVQGGNSSYWYHWHKEAEIAYITRGSVRMYMGGHLYTLNKGDVVLIPPRVTHAYFHTPVDTERIVIAFKLPVIQIQLGSKTISSENSFSGIECYSGYWQKSTQNKVKKIVGEIVEELSGGEIANEFAIYCLLNQLILIAVREIPKVGADDENYLPKKEFRQLEKSLSVISENFRKPEFGLEDCANRVGFCASYFSRYFKAQSGITFQNYLRDLRISHAMQLLLSTDMSITAVSYQSGYSNIKTFNCAFKNECGMSPREYRKTMVSD